MQPQGVNTVRYWKMTLWWIYMAKTIYYMHIWLSGVLAICIEQVFSYLFGKTDFLFKGWHHGMKPMTTTNVHLEKFTS